jgi:predicted transcriptional regulator of viral defense system
MNFKAFAQKYGQFPLIKSSYFSLETNPAYLRRLVSDWLKKGWLLELRRGMYLINENYVLKNTERFYLANQLYEPSYLSLESALSFYGMIPEGVSQITSVTTRKTIKFSNVLGTFRYSTVKRSLFWGYIRKQVGEVHVLFSTPEKALLDLVYLRMGEFGSAQELVDSMRLQSLAVLDKEMLLATSKRFGHPKVIGIAQELSEMLKSRRKPA